MIPSFFNLVYVILDFICEVGVGAQTKLSFWYEVFLRIPRVCCKHSSHVYVVKIGPTSAEVMYAFGVPAFCSNVNICIFSQKYVCYILCLFLHTSIMCASCKTGLGYYFASCSSKYMHYNKCHVEREIDFWSYHLFLVPIKSGYFFPCLTFPILHIVHYALFEFQVYYMLT